MKIRDMARACGVLLCIALACAILLVSTFCANRSRWAIEELSSNGAVIWDLNGNRETRRRAVSIDGRRITIADMALVAQIDGLYSVTLSNCNLDSGALDELTNAHTLAILRITGARIEPQELCVLRQCESLQHLAVSTTLSETMCDCVAGIADLSVLELIECAPTKNAGVLKLSNAHLKEIAFIQNRLTQQHLDVMAGAARHHPISIATD